MPDDTITCGDLSLLGGPWDDLLRHDPRRQTADEPHCWCWRDPSPEDWTPPLDTPRVLMTSPPDLPASLLEQECRAPVWARPEPEIALLVCCRCSERFDGVLEEQRHRGVAGGPLLTWLRQQVRQAVAWRDEQRQRRAS
jgi:hypothetical protein